MTSVEKNLKGGRLNFFCKIVIQKKTNIKGEFTGSFIF